MDDEDNIQWKCEGKHCRVGLTRKVSKAFEGLDARTRAGLLRWMAIFAREGGSNIPPERFKHERRVSVRSGTIAVCAFKEWQARLYGAYLPDAIPPSFLLTECDVAKKQNKADAACIERAARIIDDHLASTHTREKKR